MFEETEQRCTHLVGSVHDMTEQKQAERALKRSEREFRAIFDQAPLGIAVVDSRTGRFLKVNRQYCAIAGYSESEMLLRTFQSITHPDDLQKDLDGMRCLLDGKLHTYQMEKRYIRKDDSVVWVSLTCVALSESPGTDPQHIAMIDDITDRKQAEDRLAESERKYRMLVEHANSIILRWGSDGRVIFLNEFGQRFFGYSEDEILGQHVIGTIVAPAERGGRDLRRLMDQICTDPKAFEQNVNENMRRNGERVWIAWTNRIVRDAHGQGAEILSVGTDITARRQAQEEVRRLNEDLQRHAEELERRVAERTAELAVARDRAQAADHLKSAFLATMSHELRTPLNSIIGFTGIVLKGLAGPLTAEQHKQLDMVRASARHLLNLINDVLDISKIEAGELTVHCEPVDLQPTISKAAGIVRPLAERKGLAFRVQVPPDLGQTLSDERRVQQVLLNLLTNAVKFTDRGEVALTVEMTSNAVHMRVEDTGIGIKPEDLAIVFQPFRQVDSGTTRNYEGTGLGLAISRRLAELMGGEVRAASEWGKGSVFTFTLPVRGPVPK
jgi:PAS domain S-box-containing protein